MKLIKSVFRWYSRAGVSILFAEAEWPKMFTWSIANLSENMNVITASHVTGFLKNLHLIFFKDHVIVLFILILYMLVYILLCVY